MSLNLANGSSVHVVPPDIPALRMDPPAQSTVIVVPVQGPVGPTGPPGKDVGAAGGFQWPQTFPATEVTIHHGLDYKPSGIVCIENDGFCLEFDTVTHPSPGYITLTFGVGFVGTIYLS